MQNMEPPSEGTNSHPLYPERVDMATSTLATASLAKMRAVSMACVGAICTRSASPSAALRQAVFRAGIRRALLGTLTVARRVDGSSHVTGSAKLRMAVNNQPARARARLT